MDPDFDPADSAEQSPPDPDYDHYCDHYDELIDGRTDGAVEPDDMAVRTPGTITGIPAQGIHLIAGDLSGGSILGLPGGPWCMIEIATVTADETRHVMRLAGTPAQMTALAGFIDETLTALNVEST